MGNIANVSLAKKINMENGTKEMISKNEEQINAMYDNVPIGLYRTTPNGKVLLANKELLRILGFNSLPEFLALNLNDTKFLSESDYNRDVFKRRIEEYGVVKNFKSIWRKKNGDEVYICESANAHRDKDGNILYYEGIVEDITEKQINEDGLSRYIEELQLNKDLIEQNAKEYAELTARLSESEEQLKELNRSKDKFFSIISHDLRSPFNSLIGFSDLLVKNFDDFQPDEVKNIAQNLNQSIKNLYKLIENLLQWSGLQTGKMVHRPKILNLHLIVYQIYNLLHGNAIKKNISITNETQPELHIYADETMINSIIQNLMSNAIKFTKPSGTIQIVSRIKEGFVEVTISDTGVGIDNESLEKLFRIDSNISTKGTSGENGTGLGLILCKELVEKNKGTIKVESELGKGTSFIFTLPYVKDPENYQHEINLK